MVTSIRSLAQTVVTMLRPARGGTHAGVVFFPFNADLLKSGKSR